MSALCFIDTETTGVHPDRQVWEVAMIRRDESGQRETQFYVDVDLSLADPFGLSVGRFYERHPDGQNLSGRRVYGDDVDGPILVPRHAAREVAQWTHGAHLVGAVPNFDAETLDRLLREHELIPAWHYHLVDVEALAVGYLHGRRFGETGDAEWSNAVTDVGMPWKSDELTAALGLDPPTDDERHTAMGDAVWAMRLYDAITGGAW